MRTGSNKIIDVIEKRWGIRSNGERSEREHMGKANLCALLNFSLNKKLNRQGNPTYYKNH